MNHLPSELISIIVWDAFFDVELIGMFAHMRLLTICRKWHSILTNINTRMVTISDSRHKLIAHRMRTALQINRSVIFPHTIKQYFPILQTDSYTNDTNDTNVIVDYMRLFSTSYRKETWQYARLPTQKDLLVYKLFNPHYCGDAIGTYTKQLVECWSTDAFFYLYYLVISGFAFGPCYTTWLV